MKLGLHKHYLSAATHNFHLHMVVPILTRAQDNAVKVAQEMVEGSVAS